MGEKSQTENYEKYICEYFSIFSAAKLLKFIWLILKRVSECMAFENKHKKYIRRRKRTDKMHFDYFLCYFLLLSKLCADSSDSSSSFLPYFQFFNNIFCSISCALLKSMGFYYKYRIYCCIYGCVDTQSETETTVNKEIHKMSLVIESCTSFMFTRIQFQLNLIRLWLLQHFLSSQDYLMENFGCNDAFFCSKLIEKFSFEWYLCVSADYSFKKLIFKDFLLVYSLKS